MELWWSEQIAQKSKAEGKTEGKVEGKVSALLQLTDRVTQADPDRRPEEAD